MSKWFDRQKNSFLKQRPSFLQASSGESEQFEQLFRYAFNFFRLFALTPGQMSSQKEGFVVRDTRWMRFIVIVLVLLVWIALIESFQVHNRTALITGIANHIQLITNTIALTVAWIVPQLKASELQAILEGYLVIDRELSSYKLPDVTRPTKGSFLFRFALVLLGLTLLVAYDGFVSFGKSHSPPEWYWLATQVPFVVQAMGIFHAFLLISWLHERFQHLNALVEQYYRQGLDFSTKKVAIAFATPIKLTDGSSHANVVLDGTPNRRELADDLQILAIVSRTIDLAQKIESYFGPLFLTVYTALFTVTTVQSYYCYLHLNAIDERRGLSVESLILSGGIIVANIITIVALPFICERVEQESKLLMSFLSKLSMRPGQQAQHSSIWFSNLIASVRFSALGFFTINYNMLSGLVAGLVTYLIIFIQFNSMVPAGKEDLHMARSKYPRHERDSDYS
ncbi:AGAP011915-PA-like protein [Anopheles sinensis]|uniref:Gustatory receptor n=1 Tax=Anopheles sinensis TaxID=74873 RepID=A0A084WIK8_ANOSI|nr:AGAP011915-PA-like protein [Anopheles sinensis]